MADHQKLTQLTELATLSADDLFYVVDDPAGAANQRKMAASVLDARYASASQGALADTALQNAALFATAAQGALAATALQNAAAFATAAQGATADTALQAAAIGVTVQAYDAGLSAITAFGRSLIDDVDATAGRATLVAAGTGDANTFTLSQIFSATGAITLAGTAHAVQVGASSSTNIAASTTAIQARSNGASAHLGLNLLGGSVGVRANAAAVASGMYVAWISGDARTTFLVGSGGAANDQIAIRGISYSNNGVQGDSESGSGVYGISVSGRGLSGYSTSNNGGYFSSASNVAFLATSNTGAVVEAVQITGPVSSVTDLFLLRKRPLTTAANGFGAALLFTLSSSTTADQLAGRLSYEWATATHASRKARSRWTVHDTAEREAIRIEADGAAAMVGFYGSAAVAKQAVTGSRGGNAALADLLAKLALTGLITDSTTV